ncbi:MAG: ATP-binding cassette domain-containing protein, partial [Candidatus Altiarchaeota archaeon]|nr:ATP-binding cassette domain-containing protein [Candidatus Altiarchaeota archaeon]
MEVAISVKKLKKRYKDGTLAVNNISFEVKRGEIFGFLGPNGAGKTSTIKLLTTLMKPSSGEATVAGFDIGRESNQVRQNIGIVFQEPALDSMLTGRENLDFHARLYGIKGKEIRQRIEEVLKLVGMEKKADVPVKNYSGGMKRRLELARGLMHSPKILFLDEPTLGLDVQTRGKIWEYILKVREKENMTIFMTTHYMEEAEKVCERIAIIDAGKILKLDKPENLVNGNFAGTIRVQTKDKIKPIRGVRKIQLKPGTVDLKVN